MASISKSNSDNVLNDPVEQEINDDMNFIAGNISAGGNQTATIFLLRDELLRRRKRGRGSDMVTLFTHYKNVMTYINANAKNGNYGGGTFNTLHGGPLSAAEIQSGIPPIFRVPDGCIIAMLAPPGTVVYGGEEEDMMSWRFFKQAFCFGAAGSSSAENCFGADGKKASVKRNLDQANKFEIPPEEKENVKKMGPAAFVSYRHRKLSEKKEERELRKENSALRKQGECSKLGKEEIIRQMTPRVHIPGGHEILENNAIIFWKDS